MSLKKGLVTPVWVTKPLCCSHYIRCYFSSSHTAYPLSLMSFSEAVFSWTRAFTEHKVIYFFKNFELWSINDDN